MLLRVAKQHLTELLQYSAFQISFSQQPLITSSPSNFTKLKNQSSEFGKAKALKFSGQKTKKESGKRTQAQGFVKESIQYPPGTDEHLPGRNLPQPKKNLQETVDGMIPGPGPGETKNISQCKRQEEKIKGRQTRK